MIFCIILPGEFIQLTVNILCGAIYDFIFIISFFKVDFCITFRNYKKLINVNLPRKPEITQAQNGLIFL